LREVHPHAGLAAEAAEAAGAQQKFWPVHNLLFGHQRQLKANNLREYAAKAELDLERYDAEMRAHLYLQRIQEHIDSGNRSGVRATPTFFVNGVVQDTSFGILSLQAAIDIAMHAVIPTGVKAMAEQCEHLKQIQNVMPSAQGCEDCLKTAIAGTICASA
jgi:hypothetical protein